MQFAARLFLRYRRLALVLLGLITAVAMIGAARVRIDDVPTSIFRTNDPTFDRLEELFRDFGTDDGDTLLFVEGADPFSPEGANALRAMSAAIAQVEGVATVVSLATIPVLDGGFIPRPLLPSGEADADTFEAARQFALEHPVVGGRLLAPDGLTNLLIARLDGAHLSISDIAPRVDAITAAIDETRGPWTVRMTGVPPLRRIIFEAIRVEQTYLAAAGALVGILVGLWVFRRPGPVILTTAASVLAAIWGLGAMGWMGESMNLMNAQLPLLIMVIAFTDSIHLVIHILRRRTADVSPMRAAAHAVRHLGVACALTSFTTAVGFASLAVSRVEIIRRFGIVFSTAVAMTFFVVLTVVPLFSVVLLRQRKTKIQSLAMRFDWVHDPAERLVRWVVERAQVMAWIGVASTIVLSVFALRLTPENRLTEAAPIGEEAVAVLADVETAFGGSLGCAVMVDWKPGHESKVFPVLRQVESALDTEPLTHAALSVASICDLLPGPDGLDKANALPETVRARLLRTDLRRALVTMTVPDEGTIVANAGFDRLQVEFDRIQLANPGFTLEVTGTGYVARRNVNLIIHDFALGIWIAAGVIFLAIALAFRSLRIGLISIVPNAFPLAVAGATLYLLNIELQVSSAIAFTVCLGIAVDDTIHYLARYRRELKIRGDRKEAAVHAFLSVGRALAVTTAILAGSWGALLFSAIPTTVLFGKIAVIGLLAALIGDLIFLPAMLVVWGGRGRQGPSGITRRPARP
tara:strand:- start:16190 stop:18439 length:2250 start_codon:yes stop_codon:yes gene_type:complete